MGARSRRSSTFKNQLVLLKVLWNKVFKNGQSKICGRQLLKNLKGYGLLGRPLLLGPFLNILSLILWRKFIRFEKS